jgi:two-component system, chemotaxis family, sensor histidine kinase and response regulator WspE
MLELFRREAENQAAILTSGLLEVDRGQGAAEQLESLMRAAHSFKGAARIVDLPAAVAVAHAMEDGFALAQQGKLTLGQPEVDLLFRGVDVLLQIARHTEPGNSAWQPEHAEELRNCLSSLRQLAQQTEPPGPDVGQVPVDAQTTASDPSAAVVQSGSVPVRGAPQPAAPATQSQPITAHGQEPAERVVRLAAESLNRLLGMAGEALVETRWLRPFADSLQQLSRQQAELSEKLDDLRQNIRAGESPRPTEQQLGELARRVAGCQQFLSHRLQELEIFDRRSAHRSQRMYLEVVRMRMRPFSDGVRHFPRMVRDLARAVGKRVRLEIIGENIQVDRDILERLESPLAHLLRNAVDHGCETPEQRQKAGKPPEGTIRLEARHNAGMLQVTVADDGAGVHPERVREAIMKRNLASPAVAQGFTEAELLEFLFLPGFTLKETVTEISGRGVGLDIVQNMVRSVRGSLRVNTHPGRGLRIQLQLPLTLSVLRALLVEVAGEPYAFPLTQIARAMKLPLSAVGALENRRHFQFEGQQVGLVAAHRVFDCGISKPPEDDLAVVVLGDRNARYGLVVDRFLGERELVVQPLDPRLGKVTNISAAAMMEDGAPVLIVDVDDLLRSVEALLAEGHLAQVQAPALVLIGRKQKRVLAVDDSLTVRELVRKLLANHGYQADVAVDGVDGWNAVRTGHYDLVIADIDMPRLDGIELAALIKKDPQLKSLPIVIVSYKDSEEDRLRGMEAGADYYLTKASFDDESLLRAVVDLIGESET